MLSPQDIIEKDKNLKPYMNNNFLIIPLDKIMGINVNDVNGEETLRLHLDILKIGG